MKPDAMTVEAASEALTRALAGLLNEVRDVHREVETVRTALAAEARQLEAVRAEVKTLRAESERLAGPLRHLAHARDALAG